MKKAEVRQGRKVSDMLEDMREGAFQARTLGEAVDIWGKMLKGRITIFLGLAGAMVPAGMRKIIVYLIKRRMIDCLVSTGANLFHDVNETIGKEHYRGAFNVNDAELCRLNIDRIYDVFANDWDFIHTIDFLCVFHKSLNTDNPLSTREYFYHLGRYLQRKKKEDGIVTAAYRYHVPIYCPSISDSSFGIACAVEKLQGEKGVLIDTTQDVVETSLIDKHSKKTAVIYVGGGVPKNFIQQAELIYSVIRRAPAKGHDYAIQITTDAPHWGGLSGCTLEEAQSLGKVAQGADMTTVYADATIALPLLVNAVADTHARRIAQRTPPDVLEMTSK